MMKLTLGICFAALVFLLSAPNTIEAAPKREQSDAVHNYCAESEFGSFKCLSGWDTPPPQETTQGSYYHECSFWEGDGCSSGYRKG